MASDTAYSSVRTFLEENWTTIKLLFDNENVASDGETRVEQGTDPWIMVEMTGDFRDQASIGAGDPADDLWREGGQILFTVMVKSGTGSRLARQYARQLSDLFRGLELSNGTLRFLGGSIGLGEISTRNGKWYGLPLNIDYELDS